MSELTNTREGRSAIRSQMLMTVSAFALLAVVSSAQAADDSHPLVWIELGGQLESVESGQQPFSPPFTLVQPQPAPFSPVSPLEAQKPPRYAIGGEGKISFEPDGSDWVFSAAVRYGRSNGKRHVHQQTSLGRFHYGPPSGNFPYLTPTLQNFADTKSTQQESHAVLDFQAGKDVGLGMFGRDSTSLFSVGVRFAQFNSRSQVSIYGHPHITIHSQHFFGYNVPAKYFHNYLATSDIRRSFRGVGPSLSWTGSAPFVGNPNTTEIALDWGINGALLFGRQKVSGSHKATAYYFDQKYQYGHQYVLQYQRGRPVDRSRTVTVPNLGGFAGLSFHRGIAKVSLGYRADFFFGALDGGVDVAKKANVGFYGPFATVSVGIGG